MPRFTYRSGSNTYTIDLTPNADGGWIVEIDGVRYAVEAAALSDGGLRLRIEGETMRAYTASDGDNRFVWVDGAAATFEGVRGRGRARAAGDESGRLTAQMPGLVRAVLVAPGDAVTRGQTLAILEAMKMELRITAPRDGRVRAAPIAEGVLVERGALLLELEREEGGVG